MRLQERLSLCAKEHALLALSGTHSSSAQKKLLEFLCNPKTSEAQRISTSAAADPWGAAAGTCRATRTSSLQVQRDRRSVCAGFSCSSRSSPVSYLPMVTQLQHEKYWMFLTELNWESFGERYLLGWRREPGWEGTSDFSGRCFIAI